MAGIFRAVNPADRKASAASSDTSGTSGVSGPSGPSTTGDSD